MFYHLFNLSIADSVLDGILSWVLNCVSGVLDFFNQQVLTQFSFSASTFKSFLGNSGSNSLLNSISSIMIYCSLALIFTITAWQLFKSFGGKYLDSEPPIPLVGRAVFFSIFATYSYNVLNWLFTLLQNVFAGFLDVSTTQTFSFSEKANLLLQFIRYFVTGSTGTIILLILLLVIAWSFFKILLEVVERYVVLFVLYYTSPLALAMGPSKSTADVFKNWTRMFASQCVVLLMNVLFMKMFVVAIVNFFAECVLGTPLLTVLTHFLMIIAFSRVIQHFDEYLGQLGFHTARTGGNMMADLMGGMALVRSAGSSLGRVFGGGGGLGGFSGAGSSGTASSILGTGAIARTVSAANGTTGAYKAATGSYGLKDLTGPGAISAIRNANKINANGVGANMAAKFGAAKYTPGAEVFKHSGTQGAVLDAKSVLPQYWGKDGQGVSFNASKQMNQQGRFVGEGVDAKGRGFSVMATNVNSGYKPTGAYSIATGVDGTQYYVETSGAGANSLSAAPQFNTDNANTNAAQGRAFFGEQAEGYQFSNAPNEEGVLNAVDADGNQSTFYSGAMFNEPEAPHETFTDAYGNEWYKFDQAEDISGLADASEASYASPFIPEAGTDYDTAVANDLFDADVFDSNMVASPIQDADGNFAAGVLAIGALDADGEVGDAQFTAIDSAVFGKENLPEGAEQIGDSSMYYVPNNGMSSNEIVDSLTGGQPFNEGVGDSLIGMQSEDYDVFSVDDSKDAFCEATGISTDDLQPVMTSSGDEVAGAYFGYSDENGNNMVLDGSVYGDNVPEGFSQIDGTDFYAGRSDDIETAVNFGYEDGVELTDAQKYSMGEGVDSYGVASEYFGGVAVPTDETFASPEFNSVGADDATVVGFFGAGASFDDDAVVSSYSIDGAENGSSYLVQNADGSQTLLTRDANFGDMNTDAGSLATSDGFSSGAYADYDGNIYTPVDLDDGARVEQSVDGSFGIVTPLSEGVTVTPSEDGSSFVATNENGDVVPGTVRSDGNGGYEVYNPVSGDVKAIENEDASFSLYTKSGEGASEVGVSHFEDINGDSWTATPIPQGQSAEDFVSGSVKPFETASLDRGSTFAERISSADENTPGVYHVTTQDGRQQTFVDTARYNTDSDANPDMGKRLDGNVTDNKGHTYARYEGFATPSQLPSKTANVDRTAVSTFAEHFGQESRVGDYASVEFDKGANTITARERDGAITKYYDASRYAVKSGEAEIVTAKNGHKYIAVKGSEGFESRPVRDEKGNIIENERQSVPVDKYKTTVTERKITRKGSGAPVKTFTGKGNGVSRNKTNNPKKSNGGKGKNNGPKRK